MFGKMVRSFLAYIFASLIFTGCAQPKYINGSAAGLQNPLGSEQKMECDKTFPQLGLCLFWYWEKPPTESEAGTIIFKIYRANVFDDSTVMIDSPSLPNVVLWMPGMGHGSSPTKINRLDVGTYRASEVFFIMPGEWELKFQIKEGSEVIDESTVQITF